LVVGVALAGCTTPKSALGVSSLSPCFRTLPAAHQAVREKGKFLGVRYLTVAQINADLKHTRQLSDALRSPLASAKSAVCAVGYEGEFSASAVEKPWPPGRGSGKDALVLVNVKSNKVFGTILLSRPPLRLSKI
jgi:hypothetical protein